MVRITIIVSLCLLCLGFTANGIVRTNEIIISNLDKLVDSKYISEKDTNLWRALSYKTEKFAGVMLAAGGGPKPVPITIRLGIEGLYRVHLGMYNGYGLPFIRVRLSKEQSHQKLTLPSNLCKDIVHDSAVTIYEVPWKDADLTGQDLVLEQAGGSRSYPGALAYIRLESIKEISAKPESKPKIDIKRKVRYPLAITNDGDGIFRTLHSRPEDLLKPFDEKIPKGSCMRILLWGNGNADICNYPTKVGNFYPNGHDFSHPSENALSKNMSLWKEKGWDSLKLMREYAKKRRWEFHVYIRMEAFNAHFPFDWRIGSDFFNNHPQFHCFDRKGLRVGRLSYAYPQVQEHMLNLIKEIAEYEPDGICLCFIRGVPLVLYEPIMVEGFKKKYGIDPRELEECDPRWTNYQGQVITSFVKKAKAVLKPHQRLSAIVPGNELDCRKWGLDISTWVKECIVDDLFPVGQRFGRHDVHYDDPDNLDFDYFSQLEGREKMRLIPMLYCWTKFNKDYLGWRQLMYSFLERGADGYGVWDAMPGDRFGRVEDIGYETKSEFGPETEFRRIKLKSLQGFRVDRYHHFEVI